MRAPRRRGALNPKGTPMRLEPGSRSLIVLLGTLAAAGPLGTDLYLPALPELARVFGAGPGTVQLTLSGYMLGMALGQLIYGPLSDRFGRRPVLLAGMVLFALTSLGCAFAPTAGALIGLRILQGLSAAAPSALSRAVVRDLYAGEAAAKTLAYMAAIMGATPVIAPLIGGELLLAFGWESTFLAIGAMVVATGIAVLLMLPETNTKPIDSIRPLALAQTYWRVAGSSIFRSYVFCGATCFGGLFAFISGSSFVLQDTFGLSPRGFAIAFALMVLGYIAGTLSSARVVGRLGLERTLGIGVALAASSGLAMAALAGLGTLAPALSHPAALVGPQIVYAMGLGFVLPQVMAGALTPFPQIAGTASAVLGFLQMSFSAAMGVLAGFLAGYGFLPLAVLIACLGTASALGYLAFVRPRTQASLVADEARAETAGEPLGG